LRRKTTKPNTQFTDQIITSKSKNPFRPTSEIGDVADIISFNRDFLGRNAGDKQKETLIAMFGDKPGVWNQDYHEHILVVGMKGGKNYVAEPASLFVPYFINCLKDPWDYFSNLINPGTKFPYGKDKNFDIVNVSSVDAKQAQKAFFENMKNALRMVKDPRDGSNWFEKCTSFGGKPGLDLRETDGDLQKDNIEFPKRPDGPGTVRFLSFNSTSKAPEGLHMFFFIADELSRAKTKADYLEAVALYELGSKNTGMSFPKNVGKTFAFSYPNMTDYDYTWELYELYETGVLKNMWARKWTTFEFNPSKSKDDVIDEYIKNPVSAMCTYECVKPVAENSFFQPHVDRIDQCIDEDIHNKITYSVKTREVPLKTGVINKFTTLDIKDIEGDMKERCFFMDASRVKDRFVIGGGYTEPVDVHKMNFFIGDKEDIIITNKKFIMDVLLVIEPMKNAPIDFIAIGDYLTLLVEKFPNIRSINSDSWQEAKLLQELSDKGISSKNYKFSNAEQLEKYTKYKMLVYHGLFKICKDTYEGHKIVYKSASISLSDLWSVEAKSLISTGTKIDHPRTGSKDVQDVAAFLANDLLELDLLNDGITGVSEMSEPKIKLLVTKYATIKWELIKQGIPREKMDEIISKQIGMDIDETKKIAEYVRETYAY
jgi:hypothetical protein